MSNISNIILSSLLLCIVNLADLQAGEIKESKFDTYYTKAISLGDKNEVIEAMEQLDSALLIEPNNYNGMYYKGQLLIQIAENYNAIEIFQQVIKLYPKKGDPYTEIAMIYNTLQKYDSALKYIDLALAIEPKNSIFNNNKGVIYYSKGDFKNATLAYSKAILFDNKNYLFYNNRALCKYNLDETKGALEDFNSALRIAEISDPLIYYYRGITYLKMKNEEAACKDFTKALEGGSKEASEAVNLYCKKELNQEKNKK